MNRTGVLDVHDRSIVSSNEFNNLTISSKRGSISENSRQGISDEVPVPLH